MKGLVAGIIRSMSKIGLKIGFVALDLTELSCYKRGKKLLYFLKYGYLLLIIIFHLIGTFHPYLMCRTYIFETFLISAKFSALGALHP